MSVRYNQRVGKEDAQILYPFAGIINGPLRTDPSFCSYAGCIETTFTGWDHAVANEQTARLKKLTLRTTFKVWVAGYHCVYSKHGY